MNQFSRVRTPLLLFIVLAFAGACLEELGDLDKVSEASVAPAIAFPLVNSDFTLEEFLTEGNTLGFVTEQNNVLVITYKDSLLTPTAETFFNVPDQQSPTVSFSGPDIIFPTPGGSFTFSETRSFTFSTTEQLDSILFKAGQMTFNIQSDMPADIDLTITITSLKEPGGAVFSQNFVLSGVTSMNPAFDLQDAVLDLTENGTTTNTLTFSITAVVSDSGSPLGGTSFSFDFDMTNLMFRGLFGQLSTQSYQTPVNSLDIDIFNNVAQGTFSLESPSIRLDVANSFGLPLSFDISQLTAIQKDGTVLSLSGAAATPPLNPYLLSAPTIAQLGEEVSTTIVLDNTNSNLNQFISALPDNLVYRFGGQINPDGVGNNFVLDVSRLEIDIDVELPLHGTLSGLTLSKQFDFDGIGIDDVLESKVIVKTVNEFPFDVILQVYFQNAGGVVDSLFVDNQNFINAADVDSDGFSQGPVESIKLVTLDKARADRIDQAEFLRLVAIISTTSNGSVPVKVSIADRLRVTVGVNTKVEYKFN
jgi:hypothetical protein